jgi:hypothetical protein
VGTVYGEPAIPENLPQFAFRGTGKMSKLSTDETRCLPNKFSVSFLAWMAVKDPPIDTRCQVDVMLIPLCRNERTRFIAEDNDSGCVANAKITVLSLND